MILHSLPKRGVIFYILKPYHQGQVIINMSKDYYKLRVDAEPCDTDITDLAAAFLADNGFESFEPDLHGVTAYIPVDATDDVDALCRESLEGFPMKTEFSFKIERVQGRDWNEEWEKNYFKPIVIEGRCVIHSSFHQDVPKAEYDIVIDPKMAFGTGHHHTTSRMTAWLLQEDLAGKSLIDMGTGTGILAILASMRGAEPVTGIEIDPGAWENAVENAALNHRNVNMILGDASALDNCHPADFFLANINRNIILDDLEQYVGALRSGGVMLLSGFYDHDLPMIIEAATKLGLNYSGKKLSDNWCAARFVKA